MNMIGLELLFANVCKYTMPPEGIKRESLSYKPTGWVQYLYGENNSKHLYERCHLIAWQLSNENNNKKKFNYRYFTNEFCYD